MNGLTTQTHTHTHLPLLTNLWLMYSEVFWLFICVNHMGVFFHDYCVIFLAAAAKILVPSYVSHN